MQRKESQDSVTQVKDALKANGLADYYVVSEYQGGVMIKESDENFPGPAQKSRLTMILQARFSESLQIDESLSQIGDISVLLLRAVKKENESKHNSIPQGFENLPEYSFLSPDFKPHIQNSLASNPMAKLNHPSDVDNFPDELKSPISLEIPQIPVKLRCRNVSGNLANHCYDLREILLLPADEDGMRTHPLIQPIYEDEKLTNPASKFSIADIIPAVNELKIINNMVEEANALRKQMVFPRDAIFNNKEYPAIFVFGSNLEALALFTFIQKTQGNDPSLKISGIKVENNIMYLDQKNCKDGLVEKLLSPFEFKDENDKKEMKYLGERTKNLDEHYSGNRVKKMFPGISRNDKCKTAFAKLQKSIQEKEKLAQKQTEETTSRSRRSIS